MVVNIIFFFKQKTAYDMRISDWSSDVCSSDLDRKSAFRQYVAFGEHFAHDDRAQRRHRRGLHHEGTAHRDRRRDLVRGEVAREIERRDEAARPDRHPLPHTHIAPGPRRHVLPLHLAIIAPGLTRRAHEALTHTLPFTLPAA